MNHFWKHLQRGLLIALIWGITWAVLTVLAGSLLSWLTNFDLEQHVDPMAAMALPGFIIGLIFYSVLILIKHRMMNGRAGSWVIGLGTAVGLFCGVFVMFMGTPNPEYTIWQVLLAVAGTSTVLSTVSAAVSTILLRKELQV